MGSQYPADIDRRKQSQKKLQALVQTRSGRFDEVTVVTQRVDPPPDFDILVAEQPTPLAAQLGSEPTETTGGDNGRWARVVVYLHTSCSPYPCQVCTSIL